MVGGALERGGKKGHDRLLIRNQPTIFFLFFGFTFWALVGYWSAVPLQLGAESDRALCPAPVTPSCHRSIRNISLFFSSPMQASPPPPTRSTFADPFWTVRAPILFGLVPFPPARMSSSVCPATPPHFVPCSLTAHFFFFLSRTQRSHI